MLLCRRGIEAGACSKLTGLYIPKYALSQTPCFGPVCVRRLVASLDGCFVADGVLLVAAQAELALAKIPACHRPGRYNSNSLRCWPEAMMSVSADVVRRFPVCKVLQADLVRTLRVRLRRADSLKLFHIVNESME